MVALFACGVAIANLDPIFGNADAGKVGCAEGGFVGVLLDCAGDTIAGLCKGNGGREGGECD